MQNLFLAIVLCIGLIGNGSFAWVLPISPSKLRSMAEDDFGSDRSVSELPNDFIDSIERAAKSSLSCMDMGSSRIRIDFDTTIGDQTYSSLTNTLPMVKELVKILCDTMDLSVPTAIVAPAAEEVEDVNEMVADEKANLNPTPDARMSPIEAKIQALEDTDISEVPKYNIDPDFKITRSLSIFFPDMGPAVLARRDWKMNSNEVPEVPPCVYTANIQNDPLQITDQLALIICPLYSETDFVKRVLNMCEVQAIPCIMINPDLINMDQGFGVRARNIRNDILNTFVTTYKLKTLSNGAVVREWPAGYTVWNEDPASPDGYTVLQSFGGKEPTREEINDLFDEVENAGQPKPEPASNVVQSGVNEIVGFFKGMSRL